MTLSRLLRTRAGGKEEPAGHCPWCATRRDGRIRFMPRSATIQRDTAETKIRLTVNLDGAGQATLASGVGFFDHMLTLLAKHSLIDLTVEAKGDLHVDAHHTVEDVGI